LGSPYDIILRPIAASSPLIALVSVLIVDSCLWVRDVAAGSDPSSPVILPVEPLSVPTFDASVSDVPCMPPTTSTSPPIDPLIESSSLLVCAIASRVFASVADWASSTCSSCTDGAARSTTLSIVLLPSVRCATLWFRWTAMPLVVASEICPITRITASAMPAKPIAAWPPAEPSRCSFTSGASGVGDSDAA
jgi:hypothetical protein